MSNDDSHLMSRRQALKALAAASVCPLLLNCEFTTVYDTDGVAETSFSLDDPGLSELQNVGGKACFEHGPSDLILVRADDDEILAFDRICPHANQDMGDCDGNPQPGIWDENQQTLTCRWHGSVFDRDGDVVSGPSPSALQTYPVDFDPVTGEGTVFSPGAEAQPD